MSLQLMFAAQILLVLVLAVTVATLGPDIGAWLEGLTIHPDCRNDPAC